MADVTKIAATAAKWWADKISDTANIHNHDNGEKSETAFMMSILGAMLAMSKAPSEEQVKIFENKLSELIVCELQDGNTVYLDVDYHPEGLLIEAAEAAGIDDSVFPIKTNMVVYACDIRVSAGYGKPFEVIEIA